MTDLRCQAIDWAIKYIISSTGLLWLRDAFTAYCDERGSMMKTNITVIRTKYEARDDILEGCHNNLNNLQLKKLKHVLDQIIDNPELTQLNDE